MPTRKSRRAGTRRQTQRRCTSCCATGGISASAQNTPASTLRGPADGPQPDGFISTAELAGYLNTVLGERAHQLGRTDAEKHLTALVMRGEAAPFRLCFHPLPLFDRPSGISPLPRQQGESYADQIHKALTVTNEEHISRPSVERFLADVRQRIGQREELGP